MMLAHSKIEKMCSLNRDDFAYSRPIESCQVWSQSLTQQIDLAFNVFFLFYFFLRVRFDAFE